MGAALSHGKTVDAGTATRARLAGAAKYSEFIGISAPSADHRVEIALTAAQSGAQVAQALTENVTYCAMQAFDFLFRE